MLTQEQPIVFGCEGETLVGVITRPESPGRLGVIILVGGPQYRVGSHRQFVHLARSLGQAGIASLRYDFRGMGDSSGESRTFRFVAEDVAAAVDALLSQVPQLEGVVLWGLCGGASAACLYAQEDARVAGLILVNPWLTAENTAARVALKHYYLRRFVDPAFWKKLVRGGLDVFGSVRGLFDTARKARGAVGPAAATQDPLPGRIIEAIRLLEGRSAVFLSGRDYVARTFEQGLMATPGFKALEQSGTVTIQRFEEDDHTFSSHAARQRVEGTTVEWVNGLRVDQGVE
ncbi:hydrolase 1, exosortase A system-associated [Rhodocyclaceae bacterium SMB388]